MRSFLAIYVCAVAAFSEIWKSFTLSCLELLRLRVSSTEFRHSEGDWSSLLGAILYFVVLVDVKFLC